MASPVYQEIRRLESLAHDLGPEQLLNAFEEIVASVLRWSNADRVSLIHLDWEAHAVLHFLRGGVGWADVVTTLTFQELAAGLSGWALETGEVAVSPGAAPDPRESPEVQRRRQETRCGAMLVAPIGGADRRLGTITVINRPDQPDFTERDAEELSAFAQLAGWIVRTAEARVEAKLARAEARAALNSKTNFLSNLSHELRTPLNGVLGFSHLLATSQLDDSQKTMVDTILQSGHRLLATVDNLLELAQFETGEFRLETAPFSPRAVLDAVVAKHHESAAEKKLVWDISAAVDLPTILEGDAVRIGQAWNHILSNAVKFTLQGSVTVYLEARKTSRGRTELILNVSDTGIGLSSDKSGLWFMPFHQEDGSLTRKFGGTGLGLALCDRIVRRMGGGLSLMGEAGVGTKARVWVDLSRNPKTAPQGLRVLVQTPDGITGLVLVRLLESAGHRADYVPTLQQASDRVTTVKYDLLLVASTSEAASWGDQTGWPGALLLGLDTLTQPLSRETLISALNNLYYGESS